jgi:hypothetical protein
VGARRHRSVLFVAGQTEEMLKVGKTVRLVGIASLVTTPYRPVGEST